MPAALRPTHRRRIWSSGPLAASGPSWIPAADILPTSRRAASRCSRQLPRRASWISRWWRWRSRARAAAPLGAATAALLRGLFPSAAGLSACVPSADGLGYTVATLLPPPSPHQQAAELAELLQPLACGGQLAFTLAGAPGGAERQIMAAFAASLSDRLAVRRAPCQVSSAHRRGAWDWAALPTSLPAAAANIPHPPPPSPPPASCRSPPRCSGCWTLRPRLTKPAPCPLTASG